MKRCKDCNNLAYCKITRLTVTTTNQTTPCASCGKEITALTYNGITLKTLCDNCKKADDEIPF